MLAGITPVCYNTQGGKWFLSQIKAVKGEPHMAMFSSDVDSIFGGSSDLSSNFAQSHSDPSEYFPIQVQEAAATATDIQQWIVQNNHAFDGVQSSTFPPTSGLPQNFRPGPHAQTYVNQQVGQSHPHTTPHQPVPPHPLGHQVFHRSALQQNSFPNAFPGYYNGAPLYGQTSAQGSTKKKASNE